MRITVPMSVAAALALAAPAAAGVLCVGASPCYTSIQAAVNAAAAGDTISIRAGVYFENVSVPSGLDGLQLIGASKATTILDADAPNTGNGLTIYSDGVVVKNLTIRNGQASGIDVEGDFVVIQGTTIAGQATHAVSVGWNHWYTQILANDIHSTSGTAIYVDNGFGAIVKGNTLTNILGNAIDVYGNGNQVIANKISIAFSGIYVSGNGSVVRQNSVSTTVYQGIEVVSNALPSVQGNKLTATAGYYVQCSSCFGGIVAFNSATDTVGASDAFYISADGPGLVVASNVATRSHYGFALSGGTGVKLTANKVIQTNGSPTSYCYQIIGNHNFISRNSGMLCEGPGLRLANANDNLIDSNVITTTYGNGYMVEDLSDANTSDGNVFRNNKVTGTTAFGFALFSNASNTVLTGNSATKNRKAFCDQGSGTNVSGGNAFATTAASCPIDY